MNIEKLNNFLNDNKIDALILNKNNKYFSQYLPINDDFVTKISGFTGSNGSILITKEKGYLFTDGRYLTQAKDEIDLGYFTVMDIGKIDLFEFISNQQEIKIIGIISNRHLVSFENQAINHQLKLIDVEPTFLKEFNISQDKEYNQIFSHEKVHSDKSLEEKIDLITKNTEDGSYIYLSKPSDIAYLSNLRGSDFPYSPIFKSKALLSVSEKKLFLFIENFDAINELSDKPQNIEFHLLTDFEMFLKNFTASKSKIFVEKYDLSISDKELFNKFDLNINYFKNPLPLIRAIKSKTDIENIKKAHFNETISLIKLYYFINTTGLNELSELSVVNKLEELRNNNSDYKGQSFPTIAGFGSNGAIIHYRASEKTNKNFTKDGLFLLDAGAQYLYGTTDATRTLYIGDKPGTKMCKDYTNVLMGHIDLSIIKFPKGTTGSNLDILARKYLWNNGQNYNHGTGHGVGLFLDVHEGPHSISTKYNSVELQPHMIVSNEPGFYTEGEYGIRIENLQYVDAIDDQFLCFKPLTFLPYEIDLIDVDMLSTDHIEYINDYHNEIMNKVSGHLDDDEIAWLEHYARKI